MYRSFLTALVTGIAYLLGGFDTGIEALFIMTTIDYITGMLKAICNKNVNSYIGWKGLIKKGSIFLCIIVAVQLERISRQPESIHNLVAFAFVVNEGVSIIENLIDIGVPVPEVLVRFLKKMKEDGDNKCI
jgi:toxin secretion/phage lysis holin